MVRRPAPHCDTVSAVRCSRRSEVEFVSCWPVVVEPCVEWFCISIGCVDVQLDFGWTLMGHRAKPECPPTAER
eukprot:4852820-Alexandrium_andersonii.AAC.1